MKTKTLLALVLMLAVVTLGRAATETWMTDLDAARARAAKEGKNLLIEFTGSAWCPPCKALHAEVLTTPQFAAFSRNLVLVALDYPPLSERTPEKIAANPKLAALMKLKEKYGAPGFPTMLLYTASGDELARIVGYEAGSGPARYLAQLQKR